MRVTTKGRYALRAMLHLSIRTEKKPISIKNISIGEDISPEFLEQIFFRLKNAGLISSVRGPGGGFRLSKDAHEISVLDIFSAVGETLDITPCAPCDNAIEENEIYICSRNNECITEKFWNELSDHVGDFLAKKTLRNLIDELSEEKKDKIRKLD